MQCWFKWPVDVRNTVGMRGWAYIYGSTQIIIMKVDGPSPTLLACVQFPEKSIL